MPLKNAFAVLRDGRRRLSAQLRDAASQQVDDDAQRHGARGTVFEQLADDAVARLIQPRMEAVAGRFQHATLEIMHSPMGRYVGCVFGPTASFPVTALLCAGISLEDDGGCAVSLRADLTPPVPGYLAAAAYPIDLDAPQWETVANWLEEELLRFVDAYVAAYHLATRRLSPVRAH